MQKKGIVMQIANGQAIVMTKEREFKKLPLVEGMSIGMEVDVPDVLPQTTGRVAFWRNRTVVKRAGMVAASLVLAVGLWSAQMMFNQPTAYAYVTVDINPSIELSIDEHKNVVEAGALNVEGEDILTTLDLEGLAVQEAVKTLASAAQAQGYLQEYTEVIITASPAVDAEKMAALDLDQMEDDLVDTVKTLAVEKGADIEVEGVLVSEEIRQAAKHEGVSPGKYALYLNAQSKGIDIDLEELKTKPLTKIVDERGTALADILHEIKGGKDLDGLLDTLKKEGEKGLFKGNAPAVVPNKQEDKKDGKQQPPGQEKKSDDHKKDDSKGAKDGKTQGAFNPEANDREKGGNASSGDRSGSDDKDSAKGQGQGKKDDAKDKPGQDNKQNNKQGNKHDQDKKDKESKGNNRDDKKKEASLEPSAKQPGFFNWLFGH